MRLHYPIPLLSRILMVSASGFYAWSNRPPSEWAKEEMRLEVAIKAAHRRTRQTYGAERLQRELVEDGIRVGICRIKRIRRKLGIRCKQKRKFKVSRPNAVWVSDITYVPTDEGWLYVAGHKDLFTGNIVGYAMGERLTRSLVSQSLFKAVTAKRPAKGLIHHSDRGSQYCSHKVSGGHSSRNWSITVATEPGRRRFRTLQSISRYSIIGSADRQDSGSCHR